MMVERHRILVVDDERINRKLLSELLEEHHDVVIAKSGEQALERVQADSAVDLILLDVVMPGMSGHDVLRRLKASDATKDVPVIFITSLNSVDDEEIGLDLGAADYITKPFHPGIVRLRVENHLRFVRQRKILETLAGRDCLTEIDNRRRFEEVLEREWRRAGRGSGPMSVAIIDVDYFKQYNDHYGHARGDQALKAVAKALSGGPNRASDFVARYGGEEFVMLFPGTPADGARELAESVRHAVASLAIPHAHSAVAPHLTVSIGGATSDDYQSPGHALIEAADTMLYRAKAEGRNRVLWRD
ncbi:diguanylate cyclase [Azoarcus olearius]|uniref:diguanylate cyclase n=1 Tax=Azoarcus sp. (strain BH72) TaxID=418699 RepID=A1K865_AZOSB|nr:diguanylate cyclase [Azoarcus olearius]ANQ85577.1 two-component response regulator [Azoarcus olearius]CAL95020.1 probable two-component response regulator [Azoarcus olearius]